MTVVFDAEPLLAFSFDEPGAGDVERWLDQVYDGDIDGYVTTINLAEFRYIAIRRTSVDIADAHINDLLEMGVNTYDIDTMWEKAADVKATFNPSLADAYALAAAKELDDDDGRDTTLLVGADDDYDVFEDDEENSHLIERFRDDAA